MAPDAATTWAATIPTAAWITTDENQGHDYLAAQRIYWFHDVVVSGATAADATMLLTIAADNAARLYINGVDLGWAALDFLTAETMTIPTGTLVAGQNTIMFELIDMDDHSPRGLLASWELQ